MSDIDELTNLVINFRDNRDWKQFHKSNDMAISLSLEANELLENFQLKNARVFSKYFKTHNQELFDELADVIIWIPTISHDLNIELHKAVANRVKKNAQKYPLKQSKNTTNIIRNI